MTRKEHKQRHGSIYGPERKAAHWGMMGKKGQWEILQPTFALPRVEGCCQVEDAASWGVERLMVGAGKIRVN